MKRISKVCKFRKAVSSAAGFLIKPLFDIYCALLHKVSPKRKILFNVLAENHFELFAPIYYRLRSDPRLQICFASALCHKYYKKICREKNWFKRFKNKIFGKEPALRFLRPYDIEPSKILSARQVRWSRWDVCVDASCKPFRMIFPTNLIQMFHGFSGKFASKGQNTRIDGTINAAAAKYDTLFCLSPKHAELFLQAGFLKDKTDVLCIGFPKLDALANDSISRDKVLQNYGADPSRMSVLYAPSWNPELSLNHIGEQLIELLSHQNWTLLVKLHPFSYQFDGSIKGYTRKNWDQFLDALAARGGLIHVRDQCSRRYLKAADVLITDHGTTLYEYMLLNRPILYYDTPQASSIMTMPETLPRVRQATHQFQRPQEVLDLLTTGRFADAPNMGEVRRQLAQERFYDVGGATERAVNAIYQLIELTPPVRQKLCA